MSGSPDRSLRERLAAEIVQTGPLTVAQYMAACLHDPQGGYYATRPALGPGGDFITAPLISQMFGELIGVWAASCWRLMGEPKTFRLIEMGPGDGTLMGDVLRAGRVARGFVEAADVWLVETSPPLRELQRERLGRQANWAQTLTEVPVGAPVILIANELLDCLPVRQFVRTAIGWSERYVAFDEGRLVFALGATAAPGLPAGASEGAIYEQAAQQVALGTHIGALVSQAGGAALLIDYGRDRPGFGDTLQALQRHEKVHPLASPGEADLTVHADFPAVMAAAERAGAATAILTQAQFLARMGVGERAEALIRVRPDKAQVIGRQLHRLVGGDQMGDLFKACCLHAPDWTPPAFEED